MSDQAEDDADRSADAYAAALADLRTAMAVLHACETSLHGEEERRAGRGAAPTELRALEAARMALVEARQQVQPALDEAEARLRPVERSGSSPRRESGRGGA
jgi:hypothetical protein